MELLHDVILSGTSPVFTADQRTFHNSKWNFAQFTLCILQLNCNNVGVQTQSKRQIERSEQSLFRVLKECNIALTWTVQLLI